MRNPRLLRDLGLLVLSLAVLRFQPAGAGWGPDGCESPEGTANGETFYFLVRGLEGKPVCGNMMAVEAIEGFQTVRRTDLVLPEPDVEVAVTVAKGQASVEAVLAAFAKDKLDAELESVDTWHIALTKGGTTPAPDLLQQALMEVEGVLTVTADAAEVRVSAYSPHVGTGRLLEVLKAAGCEATAQLETVSVRLKGADPAGKLEAARARLALVPGVTQAKAGKDDTVELVREKGRAGMPALGRALKGTGWSLAPDR